MVRSRMVFISVMRFSGVDGLEVSNTGLDECLI